MVIAAFTGNMLPQNALSNDDLFGPDPAPANTQTAAALSNDDLFGPGNPAPVSAGNRFIQNAKEAFLNDISTGEAIQRVRSGQINLDDASDLTRAAAEARMAGSQFGLEVFRNGQVNPYAGIPIAQLEELSRQSNSLGRQSQAQWIQTEGQRQREYDAMPVWHGGLDGKSAGEVAKAIWENKAAGLAALGGQVFGSLPAVENLIGVGGPVRQAGQRIVPFIAKRAGIGAGEGVIGNVMADPLIQSGQNARGEGTEYDAGQLAEKAVLGAAGGGIIGGGFAGMGEAFKGIRSLISKRTGRVEAAIPDADVDAAIRSGDEEIIAILKAAGATDEQIAAMSPQGREKLASRAAQAQERPPAGRPFETGPYTEQDRQRGLGPKYQPTARDDLNNQKRQFNKQDGTGERERMALDPSDPMYMDPSAASTVGRTAPSAPDVIIAGASERAKIEARRAELKSQLNALMPDGRLAADDVPLWRALMREHDDLGYRLRDEFGGYENDVGPKSSGHTPLPDAGDPGIRAALAAGRDRPTTSRALVPTEPPVRAMSDDQVAHANAAMGASPRRPEGSTETIFVNQDGVAGRMGEVTPERTGLALPSPESAPRMPLTEAEIARARANAFGGNRPTVDTPSHLTGTEGRAPRTPDDAQGQRQADQAFNLADRQRGRMEGQPDTRDTQAAGRPQGRGAIDVVMDGEFPVKIIRIRDAKTASGRDVKAATVRRYDPRTGEFDPDAPEYEVDLAKLKTRSYSPDPRQAQDFEARAKTDKVAGGRAAGQRMDEVQGLDRQTYRATRPDPTVPGADGPTSETPGRGPSTRSARPEQAEGMAPNQRPKTEEEFIRRYEEARRREQEEAERARQAGNEPPKQEGPRESDNKASNTPAGRDKDGRWKVDDRGFVKSDKGGPLKFATQIMAAKWILKQGHQNTDQVFEIANHPSGSGFAVRERGRTGGDGGQSGPTRPEAPKPDAPKDTGPQRQIGGPKAADEAPAPKAEEPTPKAEDPTPKAEDPIVPEDKIVPEGKADFDWKSPNGKYSSSVSANEIAPGEWTFSYEYRMGNEASGTATGAMIYPSREAALKAGHERILRNLTNGENFPPATQRAIGEARNAHQKALDALGGAEAPRRAPEPEAPKAQQGADQATIDRMRSASKDEADVVVEVTQEGADLSNSPAIIRGKINTLGSGLFVVKDVAGEVHMVNPAYVKSFEVLSSEADRAKIAEERHQRKFGEPFHKTEPKTAEDFKRMLKELAVAINREKQGERRWQLEAQFDELADRIGLAKTKRRFLMAEAVSEAKGKKFKIDDLEPAERTRYGEYIDADFHPDPTVRKDREIRRNQIAEKFPEFPKLNDIANQISKMTGLQAEVQGWHRTSGTISFKREGHPTRYGNFWFDDNGRLKLKMDHGKSDTSFRDVENLRRTDQYKQLSKFVSEYNDRLSGAANVDAPLVHRVMAVLNDDRELPPSAAAVANRLGVSVAEARAAMDQVARRPDSPIGFSDMAKGEFRRLNDLKMASNISQMDRFADQNGLKRRRDFENDQDFVDYMDERMAMFDPDIPRNKALDEISPDDLSNGPSMYERRGRWEDGSPRYEQVARDARFDSVREQPEARVARDEVPFDDTPTPARNEPAEAQRMAEPATDRTAQGDQYVMPGMQKSARQAMAAREAGGGMKSRKAQKDADEGLFADHTRAPQLFSGVPLDHIAKLFGGVGRAIKSIAGEVNQDIKTIKGDGSIIKPRMLYRIGNAVLGDSDASLRTWIDTIKDPALNKQVSDFADQWFVNAGTTGGKGGSFDEVVSTRINRRMNEIGKALSDFMDNAENMDQITRLVRNPGLINEATKMGRAARAIQKILKEELQYLRDAGVEIGEIKNGYFPRMIDHVRVMANQKGFLEAATKAYREAGLPQKDAREAAEAWLRKVIYDSDNIFDPPGSGIEANFVRGRSLPKSADKILEQFLVNDPRAALVNYLTHTTRHAEFVRRMGIDPAEKRKLGAAAKSKWEKIVEAIQDGGHPAMVEELKSHVRAASGMQKVSSSEGWRAFSSWSRVFGTLGMLERMVVTSLPESIMPGIRSGNAADAVRSMFDTFHGWVRGEKAKGLKNSRELAEDLGAIVSSHHHMLNMARWVSNNNDDFSAIQQKILGRYFLSVGAEQYTNASRVAAVRTATVFIRRWARESDGNLSRAFLGELGIPADRRAAFSQWVLSHKDGLPTAADLREAPKDLREMYGTAVNRFVDQSIMRPSNATKPRWATGNELGKMAFQLMSYTWAFQKNVINRPFRLMTDKELSIMEKARVTAPVLALMPLLYGMQALLDYPREAIVGMSEDRKKPERPVVVGGVEIPQSILKALSRSGLTGKLDPLLNMLTGAKYGRDIATSALGPVMGSMVGSAVDVGVNAIVRNSDKTNTTERKVADTIYNTAIEPMVNLALTYVQPHAFWAVAGARQFFGAPRVRQEFTDAVAGEPKKK